MKRGLLCSSYPWFLPVALCFGAVCLAQTEVKVPGLAQISLAGQPAGTTYRGDTVPLNAPALVNMPLAAGQGLKFTATGTVGAYGRQPSIPPEGSLTDVWSTGGSFGIGQISAPALSLIGVFAGDRVDPRATPPDVVYQTGAQDLELLAPLLQQPFYIGIGRTTEGAVKTFVVPTGATRLFLGVCSNSTAQDTGSFTATVSTVPVLAPPGNPLRVSGVAQLTLAGQPPGSSYRGDTAPLNSPPQVSLAVAAGQGLRITATGVTGAYDRQPTTPPEGSLTEAWTTGSAFGIGQITAPALSLIGVFVGDTVDPRATPPDITYEAGGQDLEVLTPLLQQPFLVGNGKTPEGKYRTFVAPTGAKRLFLGICANSVARNTGGLMATVTVVPIPAVPGNPLRVPGIAQLTLAGQPRGSTYRGDTAPLNSPPQVTVPLSSGGSLNIVANGVVQAYSRQPSIPPEGSLTDTWSTGGAFGIGYISAPALSLIGVFVGDRVDPRTEPPSINYSTAAMADSPQVSPLLQQPFYIGTGKNPDGKLKAFVVPPGATRLFLGVTSNSTARNTGFFGVTVSPDMPATPKVPQLGVVNSAAFGPPPVSAGSIITILGSNLATATAAAETVPLPASLADTRVWFDTLPAPLFLVSPNQINAQVPFEVNTGTVQLTVTSGDLASVPLPLLISPCRPGIFTVDGRTGLVFNSATGKLVSASEPAKPQDMLVIFATGLGPVSPPVPSGVAAPPEVLSSVSAPVVVTIGGVEVVPTFAGLAPGLVGVYQINVAMPGGLPAGGIMLSLSAGGAPSNPVQIHVKQ